MNLVQKSVQSVKSVVRNDLASVTTVSVGLPGDGLTQWPAGTQIDKPWQDLLSGIHRRPRRLAPEPTSTSLVGLVT